MNIFFLGLGGVGQRHLRNFDDVTNGQHNYFTLGAYRHKSLINDNLTLDSDVNIFDRYKFRFIESLYNISKFSIDIAIVSTPSSLHYAQAKLLLEQGVHIYLEKPASLCPEHIIELMHLKNSKQLKVSVVSQFRYNPLIKTLKSIYTSNVYGPPLFVESVVSEYMPNWHPYEDYRQSYASKSILGGGVIFTQIHEIDYLYFLFGDLFVHNSFFGKFSSLDIDVEDTCLAMLTPKAFSNNFPIYLRQDYLGFPPKRYVLVQFKHALVICDFISLSMTISKPNEVSIVEDFSYIKRNDLFIQQLSDFIASIASQSQSMVSLEEAFDVVTIATKLKTKT